MSNNLPKDSVMLLSYINTQLRDFYPNLDELCKTLDVDKDELENKLAAIDYRYNAEMNKFV
ncbi:DUF4250 domain-containing protein [Butyribacter sp.]|uniref:DUF4250 domain-containing protein n=1 Tax=Butyribacter sp. TaxID=2822465 RepID=UPI0003357B02|nr:DUF4250 domain-containing protein [Butyribacter sp.]CDB91189.1 putative uncharacterized protein [Clostridium sp. CAG:253]